jgi:hypothetical protein
MSWLVWLKTNVMFRQPVVDLALKPTDEKNVMNFGGRFKGLLC